MQEMSFFYTVEPVYKKVRIQEFKEFLKNYPRKLECDCCGICEPPSITYNDFELANRWPYSVVAKTFAYDDKPGDYFYEPEDERYYSIMINFDEVFASKTGNKATD